MKTHFIYLLFLLFFLFTGKSSAREPFMFKRLETKDGLSHSQINSIFKDSRGFIWFCTAGGLNRYDGYEFKVYQHNDQDIYSVTDNFINTIQEDAQGDLWIDTSAGYLLYDVRKDVFIRDISPILARYGITREIDMLYIDNNKEMWFYVAEEGIFQYQPSSGLLVNYPQTDKEGLSAGNITDICEAGNEMLFLFDTGLIESVDRTSQQVIRRHPYIPTHTSATFDRYSLFVDSDGDYWVYSLTDSGVWLYRNKEDSWQHITNRPDSQPYRLSSNVIQGIAEDNHKRTWLATDHGGINIIDKKDGSIITLQNEMTDERSLSQNCITSLYWDEMNIMWVGTYKKGVSYYSESMFKFEVNHLPYFHQEKNIESDITDIQTDASGNLWIGTNASGVFYMNGTTGEVKLYEHNPEVPSSLSSNVIVSLCSGRDGKLWIGTYLGGLNCFDGKKFTHYRHTPGNSNSPASNNIWAIQEDEDQTIWIGTLGGGLQNFDPATGTFTTYQGKDKLSSDFVSSLCIDQKNSIVYMGTSIGITLFDKQDKRFEQLTGNRAGTQRFSNQSTQDIYLDSRGLLWIATRNGLNVFNQKKDRITVIKKADGLADDFICAIIEDTNRNMWVTTSNGVSNIVVEFDPGTNQYTYHCHNYDESDGLQGREFNLRSIAKTGNGKIIMGGLNGLNIFDPDEIKLNPTLPEVVFTDFQLFNEEVKTGVLYNGNKILSSSMPFTQKIELEYRQNVFSIGFSGMNYILPEKARYLYKLEGFNSDWLPVDGNAHRVTYTNLAPGTYTFRVKAANNDGVWNEKASELTIVIHPPFWLSHWAYLFYFFLFLCVLWFARFLLIRNERNKFRIQQVELEAQQKHELDDMKLRFFTNISHELRTPLTLIISPLDGLIKHAPDETYKKKLVLMQRNGIRLLNMVNQLLDFRKSDVKGHKLNVSTGDIILLLRTICQSFAELSDKKQIRFTFTSSIETLIVDFDEDKINKVMMNLLSNAFKFTPEGGRVNVHATLLATNGPGTELFQVKVSDTGEGIKDEDKERVFERFYQADSSTLHASGGSGIGLHLVKEFIELHKGSIRAQDNPEGGTIFTFTIPVTIKAQPVTDILLTEAAVLHETAVEERKKHALINPESPLILLVEDNEDFRYFMKSGLEEEYNIQEAVNGQQAWEIIPELQPDLIISDVMMPEMDGIELTRKIKNDLRTSHIPLILLTARTAEEHKLEGLETGADDYLTKPFNFDILALRIKKLLELRNLKQDTFRKQIDIVPSEITITSLDEKLISKAVKYVEENITRSELSVEALSRELGMSRVHLYKKLVAITGKSPVEFIRIIRLKRAVQYLQKSQMNISEIAYEVGFNNPKYFSKYFKEEFGMLPSEYKQQAENNIE